MIAFKNASAAFRDANPHIFGDAHNRTLGDSDGAIDSKGDLVLEKQVQDQISGFLERNGTVAIRSRTDRKTTTNVGTPDLLFSLKGRAVAFEVKLPGKKPTLAQEEMMRQMSENGWLCFVIYSYDEAVETYRELFLKFTLEASAVNRC